ncbi:hypothetical protein NEDG_01157 [Nematocida displodere]|uniref:Uncharacterized protein n=1 Tax=Nematocida displodere TaxID=1805483 RepID=A0A177EB33_9MICR|nr:hypothetical protein NEDG_01157 [Nematocida displodere]
MFSKQATWSITIWMYNIITFVFFHAILGDPFNLEYSGLTFWEQLMIQLKGSSGITFFTAFPIVLFLFGARIAQFNNVLFLFNLLSLIIVICPKVLLYIKYYRKHKNKKHQKKRNRDKQQ